MTEPSVLRRYTVPLAAGVLFVAVALAFFALNAPAPFAVFGAMVQGAYGDGFALSISLVKATPILLCALSVALPARMGLITVGAEGQLYFGALTGTGAVLGLLHAPAWELLPAMLGAALAGGALWGAVPGLLRARLSVNETIVTILLNYVAIRLVDFVVYGPWKNAANLGWPATVSFPAAAVFPAFTVHGTTVHAEFLVACAAAAALHGLVSRSRWGLSLTLLRSNRRAASIAGVNYARNAVAVMAIAGMLAGFAGIMQAADVQGRLQPDISVGYGLSGFLVAWLAGQNFLRIIPLSLLMGGLTASADALQLFAQLPFASTVVLQGLLFGSVLALNGWLRRSKA
ncbi:MAG TPA: ABC transporter permease [Steroidobacteraceae bacterium]|jgi:simple sugar transport system permease protein|nr:ABC transporter permease [Steroidobacteraceae bacterium]